MKEIPKRPENWALTFEDLFAEMKAGKRSGIGQPELTWAREYELSLLPKGMRFPQKGDVYEAIKEFKANYITTWSAPFTGGGETMLSIGDQVWIDEEPVEKSTGVYAQAMKYQELEERTVPENERKSQKYSGFSFSLKLLELNTHFRLVKTGYRRRGN